LLLTTNVLPLIAHRSCLNITFVRHKMRRPNSPTTKWCKGSNSNTSIEGGIDQVTLQLIRRAKRWEGVLSLGMSSSWQYNEQDICRLLNTSFGVVGRSYFTWTIVECLWQWATPTWSGVGFYIAPTFTYDFTHSYKGFFRLFYFKRIIHYAARWWNYIWASLSNMLLWWYSGQNWLALQSLERPIQRHNEFSNSLATHTKKEWSLMY
jgi:hypothetical protein